MSKKRGSGRERERGRDRRREIALCIANAKHLTGPRPPTIRANRYLWAIYRQSGSWAARLWAISETKCWVVPVLLRATTSTSLALWLAQPCIRYRFFLLLLLLLLLLVQFVFILAKRLIWHSCCAEEVGVDVVVDSGCLPYKYICIYVYVYVCMWYTCPFGSGSLGMLLLRCLDSCCWCKLIWARNFGISLKCGLAFNFYLSIALKFESLPQVCSAPNWGNTRWNWTVGDWDLGQT